MKQMNTAWLYEPFVIQKNWGGRGGCGEVGTMLGEILPRIGMN